MRFAISKSLLTALLLLSLVARAEATAALVSHTIAGSSNSGASVTTSAVNTTGANLLVLVLVQLNTCNITPTDSASNSWTERTQYTDASGAQATVVTWYVLNPTTSASHTVTASGSGCFPAVSFLSFSGANVGFDVENGSAPGVGNTTLQPGSVTPSVNGEVLVSGLGIGGGTATSASIDSSFTQPDTFTDYTSAQHFGLAAGYLIQSSAAAVNPTWTVGTGEYLLVNEATFEPTAGGGGGGSCHATLSLLGVSSCGD